MHARMKTELDGAALIKAPQAAQEDESDMNRATSSSQNGTRVLMFIQSLELGGSETQCVEVARQLKAEGYRVSVGCMRADGPLKARLNESGLECVEFPVRASLLRPKAALQMLKLVAFIHRRKFEVVHTNDLYSNLFAVPAAWLARVPVIISSRRDLARWWWYTPVRCKILRKVQELSTWILVNSKAVRQELMTRDGFDAERIRVVYNGIDEEKYTQVTINREEVLPGTSSKEKLIIMVANMHVGVKGHSDLIEAARTVRQIWPEARFLLAGDGEMRPFFEDQVKAAGLERTFAFLGHRTDIPALLSCCDIGVLASRSEGLPNAILEYMAAALPVVATAVGGVPEIIENEESGLLVPPENPTALSAAILRVLKDDELRKRLGKAGRERVLADFNFTRVIGNLKHLYEGRPRSFARCPEIRAGSLSQVNSSHENL